MARILVALLLCSLGRVSAQTIKERLGFDLGLSPTYVLFEPTGTDNWSGDKPAYATTVLGSINWTADWAETRVGLGGGAFIWGDRILHPVYLQLGLNFSSLYRDSSRVRPFVRRLSCVARVGTLLGTIETAGGRLKPRAWYDVSILYRFSRSRRWRVGIELGVFEWRGPYQVRTGTSWEDSHPQILTVGPVIQFRF